MDTKLFPARLTLAIPKQEKLKEPILKYLKDRGFVVEEDGETGILYDTQASLPNIRIEFVRAADALLLMDKKVVDMAIIGSDVAEERTSGANPDFEKPAPRLDLGIAKCSFELAVPNKNLKNIQTPADLNGLRIATSYPNLLSQWLQQNQVTPAEILTREGGVESCVRMGLADVVADLVDTGKTLRKNELTARFTIAQTSAVCYSPKTSSLENELLVNEFVRNLSVREMTTPRNPVETATAQQFDMA